MKLTFSSYLQSTSAPHIPQAVLRTSLGDLDIELWAKEAPKAVRNFVQLCLEGYYDGTIFHRVLKDFMAQGGVVVGAHGSWMWMVFACSMKAAGRVWLLQALELQAASPQLQQIHRRRPHRHGPGWRIHLRPPLQG